jgi:hypothetical protein
MAAKKGAVVAPKYLTPLPKKPGAQPKVGALILSGPGGQQLPTPRGNPVKASTGNAPAGRPKSNIGSYLIRPTPESDTGFEMLNSKPEMLKQVQSKFLKLKQLPYGLRPNGLAAPDSPKYTDTPDVLEKNRAKAISRGFRDPRGRKG